MTFSQFKKELYYISEGIMLNKAPDTLETYGTPETQKGYSQFLIGSQQILIISNLSISQESPELVHELTHELAHELSIPKNQKDCKRLKKIQKIAKNPIDSKNI